MKALLLENIHPSAKTNLEKAGYEVDLLSHALNEDELSERIKSYHMLGIRSKTRVTDKVIAAADQLLAIGAFCIGTNQIDLNSCREKGIAVFNAPFSNTRSVVELALAEMIVLMRQIPEKSTALHAGKWSKSAVGSNEVRGKNLGIVGYGNIGSQLSVLAESIGLNVYFYDLEEKLALGNAIQCQSMQELLELADVVSLHVDGRGSNELLITETEFSYMKEGVVFLNLSRGKVVDLDALEVNIRSGKIKGTAVDVFPSEPKSNDEPFESNLQNLPNTLLSPHVGGSTEEAQVDIAGFVPTKLMRYVEKGNTQNSVNFPNLQLPEFVGAHRLIHIHKNVPGIIAKINNILAHHHINILGQNLKTDDQIGYVILDINKQYDSALLSELEAIEHTIRFRTLN